VGRHFDNIFVSSRVGYAKPDRRIFNAALDYHGLASSDALHVGDSETHDLRGASEAGLRAILIERRGAAATGPGRIDSLKSLPPMLND
jgi:putative hydrolase of the HAD superfamily